jgi:hypothetical protein
MSRSGENPGPRKGKRGRICTEKVTSALPVEEYVNLDVTGEDIDPESRLVVGD